MTPTQKTVVATAIANARGGRRGMPPIKNILDVLPQNLVDDVMDDAETALRAAKAFEWQSIATAPKDGNAILGYGRHTGSPPDAQRGVKAGDHWWAIMLWDIWRGDPVPNRWVFAKDGTKCWPAPTHWMPLPDPPLV